MDGRLGWPIECEFKARNRNSGDGTNGINNLKGTEWAKDFG